MNITQIYNLITSNWVLISLVLEIVISYFIGQNPNNPYNNILDVIVKVLKGTATDNSVTPVTTTVQTSVTPTDTNTPTV